MAVLTPTLSTHWAALQGPSGMHAKWRRYLLSSLFIKLFSSALVSVVCL